MRIKLINFRCYENKEFDLFLLNKLKELLALLKNKDTNSTGYLERLISEVLQITKKHNTKEFDYYFPIEIISDKTPSTWKDRIM